MTGQRFGMLTVIEKIPPRPGDKNTRWKCVCDCGNERAVTGTALRRGYCKSCGCVRGEEMELQYIKNDPNWKKKKSYKEQPCPYNEGCSCLKKECWRCGWNPKVEQARTEAIERKMKGE
jgi:hypothetical protein